MQLLLSLAPAFLAITPTFAASPEEWRGKSIYQLVTDRFAVANDSAPLCDTAARKHCGGSWKGITNHLDYIQNMGFDAVWISPIYKNLDVVTKRGEAYHGYWVKDFNALNPHFGTEDDLKELVKALHDRGMYIMLDMVVNHCTAPALPPAFDFDGYFHPFTDASYFRPPTCWTNGSMELDIMQNCWLGDPILPLPDLNTDQPRVVDLLYQNVHDIVTKYGIDGVRVDTVKHIRSDFWPGWVKGAGVYALGELYSNDTDFIAPWTQVIDGVTDYPSYFYLRQAFSKAGGPIQPFIDEMSSQLLKNAMTYLFIHDGLPIVYYGQEQDYNGAIDPSNREALWFSAYQKEKPMVKYIKTLNGARKAAIAAPKNFLTTPLKFLAVENTSFAVSKPPMLALLTNAGNQSHNVTWSVPDAGFAPNETLVDVLSCEKVEADGHGGVNVRAIGGMPQMLMPALIAIQGRALCPDAAKTIWQASKYKKAPKHSNEQLQTSMASDRDRNLVSWMILFASLAFVTTFRLRLM
ncbi:hypothetical protein EWM64_g220 [Hericium alpestre]|uniref:alpha-amylase n=1 Tax=Hericium alpestre TaxID=135208 RepID=A0A4Z0ABP7_9AGAM|nr:hypothetical protein EWM64_g220 [Hericium alpestre]